MYIILYVMYLLTRGTDNDGRVLARRKQKFQNVQNYCNSILE